MKKLITILLVFSISILFGAEHSKKLKYRKNTTTTEIKLYTTTAEVGSDRIALRDGSTTVYAKIGAVGDSLQSDLRIRDDLTTKSILLSAIAPEYLLITGLFTTASGTAANKLAKWTPDSPTWSAPAPGNTITGTPVRMTMTSYNGTGSAYICGQFTVNSSCYNVAMMNASGVVSSLGSGFGAGGTTCDDVEYNPVDGNIYFCGEGLSAGGVTGFNRVAMWNPNDSTWNKLGAGVSAECFAAAIAPNGDVFFGGSFLSVDGVPFYNRFARWRPSTSTWSKFGGTGFNGAITAITILPNSDMYLGGAFTIASGVTGVNAAVMWNNATSQWEKLGGGLYNAAGVYIHDIDYNPVNGNIYYAGKFTTASGTVGFGNIACWNPTTQLWSKLGTGANDDIIDIEHDDDGNIYIGGAFTSVNGVACSYAAKWNITTSTWSRLGATGGTSAAIRGIKFIKPL